MTDLLVAFGLMLAIEGALYAGAPAMMKRYMSQAVEMDDSAFRTIGLIALVIGVGLVWLIRG